MTVQSANDKKAPSWNSLEVAKLIVGLFVPLTILLVGHWYSETEESLKSSHEHQYAQEEEREKREVDQRFTLWEKISPGMDKIYSYFLYVGDWKDTSPDVIIQTKRQLDDANYSNIIFLTPGFFDRYQAFMHGAFDLKQGWARDPALKTVPVRPLDARSSVAFKKCDNADEV